MSASAQRLCLLAYLMLSAPLVEADTQQAADSWAYMPAPLIPADNALTPARVALGKRLFHEQRLSVTGTYSCATCHQPERHFTDGLAQAAGAYGDTLPHNTPTLYFAAYNASFGWTETGATTLEEQHLTPLFNRTPVEMGYSEKLLSLLAADDDYRILFSEAYGSVTTAILIKALASYVRTLKPPATAFDAFLFDDDATAMTAQSRAGMELFFSPRLGCSQCHASLTFSGPLRHTVTQAEAVFHVMGVGGSEVAFRAPTLRQIRNTAPYMHDGSLKSLGEVIDHYQTHPSERVPSFTLNEEEREQLTAFLHDL